MSQTAPLQPLNSVAVPPKKLGPCCVCKVTKQARDQCMFEKSEEECQQQIVLHNVCLKEHGFEVAK